MKGQKKNGRWSCRLHELVGQGRMIRTKGGCPVIDIRFMEDGSSNVYGIMDIDKRYQIVKWDCEGRCLNKENIHDLVVPND